MFKHLWFVFLMCLIPSFTFATFVPNPSNPAAFADGLFTCKDNWLSLRFASVSEYVYKMPCMLEFVREDEEIQFFEATMENFLGVVTCNFCSRVDLYGIIGSTRMVLDEQMFPKRELSWGVGLNSLLFHSSCIDISLDAKGFVTKQKPSYLIIEDELALVLSNLVWDYTEAQASLSMSYKTSFLVPYIGFSYFYCKFSPSPSKLYASIPNYDYIFSDILKNFVSRNNWGLILGTSIYACEKSCFTIQVRHFDQSSINAQIEIKF